MDVMSPQTLRGESQVDIEDAQESPYERSRYFPLSPEGRGLNGDEDDKRRSKNRLGSSKSTRNQNMPAQHENEVICLSSDSDSDSHVVVGGGGCCCGAADVKAGDISQEGDGDGDSGDDDDDEIKEVFAIPRWWFGLSSDSNTSTAAGAKATWTPASDYGEQKHPKHANSMIDNLIHPRPSQTLKTRTHLDPESRLTHPAQSFQFAGINERLWVRSDIIQPIDRRKAKSRTEYNPTTIASHVIRAIGGVPDSNQPGALNLHLWGLRSSFKAVDDNSDLATFRWDILKSDEDMPPALPYEAQNHDLQNIPVRPPTRPTTGGGPPHLGSLIDTHPNPNGFSRFPGTGGVTTYGGFVPPRPDYAVSAVPRPTGHHYQSPHNEGIYGQSSYRNQPANNTHSNGLSSRPPNQPYTGPYSVPPPPSNGYHLPPLALSRPGPSQPSHSPYAHLPAEKINLPPLNLPVSNHTSPNSSVRDSSEGGSNHPSPGHKSDASGRPNQIPPPLHQSVISGRLSQYASTPERSTSPAQNLEPPKSTASKSKSGKAQTPLFRFSKEQRATLEREATANMYPDSSVKRRLAQEIGVDLKKVTQFFQNCQAGNYSFAKKIKLAQQSNSGNNTDDDSRSVVSANGQPPTRAQYSSSPAPAPKTQRGRPPGPRVSSGLAIVLDATNDTPVQSPTPVKRLGRPPNIASSISGSPAPSAVKKKGRPFATAESAARAAEKAARRAAGTHEPRKKPGRPAKIRGQPFIKVPEPEFYPFFCEWKDCPAELHNLETLQSHIKFVHRKRNKSNMLECRWGKCCEETEIMGEKVLKGCEFEDKHDWAKHIHNVHILPVAWRMGDGPKGTDLSRPKPGTIPSWLKDSNGKLITPSIVNQVMEGGKAKNNNKKRFQAQGEGLQVVLVPVTNPEAYMKVHAEDEENEPSSESESSESGEGEKDRRDEMDVDGPPSESMKME